MGKISILKIAILAGAFLAAIFSPAMESRAQMGGMPWWVSPTDGSNLGTYTVGQEITPITLNAFSPTGMGITYLDQNGNLASIGLSIAGDQIVGTPTQAVSSYSLYIVAQDNGSMMPAGATFYIDVVSAGSNGILPVWSMPQDYETISVSQADGANVSLSASEPGEPPVYFSDDYGDIANLGLTLSSNYDDTGSITGYPAYAGQQSVRVVAYDQGGDSQEITFTLDIAAAPPVWQSPDEGDLSGYGPFTQNVEITPIPLAAEAWTPPMAPQGLKPMKGLCPIIFEVEGSSSLPPGLSIADDGSCNYTLAGIPTDAGTLSFTLVATETMGYAQSARSFSMTIAPEDTGGSSSSSSGGSSSSSSSSSGGSSSGGSSSGSIVDDDTSFMIRRPLTLEAGSSSGTGGTGALGITPAAASGMDVLAPATIGSYVTFEVRNSGATSSGTLATSLTNTTNFEIGIDSCHGISLPAAGICHVRVMPKATEDGSYTGSLRITTASGTSSASLSGTALGFAPTFLSILPGTQADMDVVGPATTGSTVNFTVSNTGTAATSEITTSLTNTTNFQIVSDTCNGQTLAPGNTCAIGVRPAATVGGTFNGELWVHAANGGTQTIAMSGAASNLGPASIGTDVAEQTGMNVDLSTGTTGDYTIFTISNNGSAATTAITTSLSNTTNFEFGTNSCSGQSLAGGATCTIQVRPKATQAGSFTGNLIISASTGGSKVVLLSGTASGGGAAKLDISPKLRPDMHVKPPATTGSYQTFTVTNIGESTTVTSMIAMSISNTSQFEFGEDNCSGTTLSGGQNCTVTVRPKGSSSGYLCASLEAAANTGGTTAAALAGMISSSNYTLVFPNGDTTADRANYPSTPYYATVTSISSIPLSYCNAGGLSAFMKFDLTGAPQNVDYAKLYVWGVPASSWNTEASAYTYYVTTSSWAEDTLTWNNMPSYGSSAFAGVGRGSPFAGGQEIYDATATYLNWVKGITPNYGFSILGNGSWCANGQVGYTIYTREAPNVCVRPYFRILENEAPVFTSTPVTWIAGSSSYSYPVEATDPSPVTITATIKPVWLTLTSTGNGTATLSGTSPGTSGTHQVSLRAVDEKGADSIQNFTITVAPTPPAPNTAPSFTSTPGLWVQPGETYSYGITTTDGEGGTLAITASVKPAWLSLADNGNGTATLSGTAPGSEGTHPIVLVVRDSGNLTGEQSFTLQVNPPRNIVAANAGRRWSDGTYAQNCNRYLTPPTGYEYSGLTGDGIYTIKPIEGLPVDVWCDMTADGGGWTLIARDTGVDFDMPYPDLANAWVGNLANRQGVLSLKHSAFLGIAEQMKTRQKYDATALTVYNLNVTADSLNAITGNVNPTTGATQYTFYLYPSNQTDSRFAFGQGLGVGCQAHYPTNTYLNASFSQGTAGPGDFNYFDGQGCWGQGGYGPVSYEYWFR